MQVYATSVSIRQKKESKNEDLKALKGSVRAKYSLSSNTVDQSLITYTSLLVTRQMALFHQGVRIGGKLVSRMHELSELGHIIILACFSIYQSHLCY